jgi:hypothetical protein
VEAVKQAVATARRVLKGDSDLRRGLRRVDGLAAPRSQWSDWVIEVFETPDKHVSEHAGDGTMRARPEPSRPA